MSPRLMVPAMITVADQSDPWRRRDLLRIGSLGMAGLSLPHLLASRAAAAAKLPNPLRDKAVIFVFQQGGPSQLETFDPKIDVPSATRTIGGTVPTKLPGVHFGEALPQLAGLADKFTVVRSFSTQNAGHNVQPLVSPASAEANIGVHFSRVAGATRAQTGMPTNAVLFPKIVCPDAPKARTRGNLAATGPWASKFAPFVAGSGGQLQSDMMLNVSRERFLHDRREILESLDQANRFIDANADIEALDEIQRQAFEVILSGGVSKAFDLSNEDPRTVARYDTARYASPGKWNKANRGKLGYYDAHAQSIGKLLLTARRLCEAGCGFVTIYAGYAGVWDMHADGNNLNMRDGMQAIGPAFDHAISAFIRDCEARGLGEKILLVCCGEMGRTPRINKRGGRDHWSRLAPLLLYGGGSQGGRVIGQSTRDGGEPTGDMLGPERLVGTILHTLLDIGALRLQPSPPKHVVNLGAVRPIPGFGR